MVRVPTRDGLEAAGPGQDYVTLGLRGDITQIVWGSTDNGVSVGGNEGQNSSPQLDQPLGAAETEIHLRIIRNGGILKFYYRVGLDPIWIELEDSPLERADMNSLEMEVGIYQTSESQATAVINDFSIRSEKIHRSGFE